LLRKSGKAVHEHGSGIQIGIAEGKPLAWWVWGEIALVLVVVLAALSLCGRR
jgi:hypothetical protein